MSDRPESSFSKVDTLWLVDTVLELAGRTIAQRRVQAVAVVTATRGSWSSLPTKALLLFMSRHHMNSYCSMPLGKRSRNLLATEVIGQFVIRLAEHTKRNDSWCRVVFGVAGNRAVKHADARVPLELIVLFEPQKRWCL